MRKHQTIITFNRELKLKRVKNKSCSKCSKECDSQCHRDWRGSQFPKFHHLLLIFLSAFEFFFRL